MKRIALVATLMVAGAASATGADMPVKALVAPAPASSWSGFYVGGNIGYSWGNADTFRNGDGTTISFPGVIPITNSYSWAGSSAQRLDGLIGGAQFGYNYQFSRNWVLGLEADIQGSAARATGAFSDSFSGTLCFAAANPPPTCTATTPINGTAATSYEARIEWFGTVRGRLGATFADDLVLLYGTGGLAYGGVKLSANTAINATPGGFAFAFVGNPQFGGTDTRIGWTAGGGVEGKFARASNWTWKVEYLYVDLGSLNIAGLYSAPNTPNFGFTPLTGTLAARSHLTDNILRVGFNYKFGGAGPVVAKY